MQQGGSDSRENPDLDAYVAGTASEADAARFEEALIASPKLAAELDVRQRIKAGLESLETRGQLQPLLKKTRPTGWVVYALAASAVIALIAAGTIWRSGIRERELLAHKPVLSLTTPVGLGAFDGSVILARTRGAPPKVTVSHRGSIVQLRLPLMTQLPDMELRLDAIDGEKPVLLPVSEAGFVEVYLDTTRLDPGRHSLVLSSGGKDLETYDLEIAFRN
jgi:hypothetical protein